MEPRAGRYRGGEPADAGWAGRRVAPTRTGCCRRAGCESPASAPGPAAPREPCRGGVPEAAVGGSGAAGVVGETIAAPPESAALAGAAVALPLPAAMSIAASSALSRDLSGPLPGDLAVPFAGAGLLPPNDSRSRRATGASTVDDADLTNSPCSLSRARTSLLVTPSSLANSCTRALPAATTSPVHEATVVGRASGLAMTHCHRDFTVCSCSIATCSVARWFELA
ncbi:Uncharacterised protein [Mycobacterium tuberculosis]|nr:Uncharacterised protein [Mycobacterium tuberculosis]